MACDTESPWLPWRHRLSWGRDRRGGRAAYLVAVGTGAAVQLHGVLAARPIVPARAGEAGVALGHNADVHWPWTAEPQAVGGGP